MNYYAHTAPGGETAWQPLSDHLRNVASLARQFAEDARPGDTGLAQAAYAAGLLHDIGKYRSGFQERLRNPAQGGESTWHKQAGAAVAARQRWADIAFAILGHHGGIPDRDGVRDHIERGRPVLAEILATVQAEIPELRGLAGDNGLDASGGFSALRTRLLFSCLVDADWIDTSAFHAAAAGVPPESPPMRLDPSVLLSRVLAEIDRAADRCADPDMAKIRRCILNDALAAASAPTGIFTLTVPTGGGKTLASLAFALSHAAHRGLRRIIYVAPYLSILEQNAEVFRRALGDTLQGGIVLEHHSLTEPVGSGDTDATGSDRADRLAENWDAPVVATTSVQFFESLFSNQPGRCRKLHNIARSAIILDECQTLPPGLTAPTCNMLQQMAEYLGCTVVLCTATQPAWQRTEWLPAGIPSATEIASSPADLFNRLRRVRVEWPRLQDDPLDWLQVAELMARHSQVLCVVNTRKAAASVFALIRDMGHPAWHLSTNMCPAHRANVLNSIKSAIRQGRPCRVVSTQLVEAGVDLDFPVVLRELAPLDSIVQAAGRCNRERTLNRGGEPGGVVMVFNSREGNLPPSEWYRKGTGIVRDIFLGSGRTPCIDGTSHISEYYRRLLAGGDTDCHEILETKNKWAFAGVASSYRIIDQNTTPVIVARWEEAGKQIAELVEAVRQTGCRAAYRQLQRYTVNLNQSDWRTAGICCAKPDDAPGLNVCYLRYDPETGLQFDGTLGNCVL